MRVGAHDHADIAARSAPQLFQVVGVGRAGVDGDEAGARLTHQVAVGAGAGHHARIGRGEALHVLEQRHGPLALPVQRVGDLAIGAHQGQFAEGGIAFHVVRFLAAQQLIIL